MDGGPPDQEPVMASPISRPKFEKNKTLECDQEKNGSHKSPNQTELLEFLCQVWHKVTQQQCETGREHPKPHGSCD